MYLFHSFFQGPSTNIYLTKISRTLHPVAINDLDTESFIVKKLKFRVNYAGDRFDWTAFTDAFRVIIDKQEFASGVTKKAYKVQVSCIQ